MIILSHAQSLLWAWILAWYLSVFLVLNAAWYKPWNRVYFTWIHRLKIKALFPILILPCFQNPITICLKLIASAALIELETQIRSHWASVRELLVPTAGLNCLTSRLGRYIIDRTGGWASITLPILAPSRIWLRKCQWHPAKTGK